MGKVSSGTATREIMPNIFNRYVWTHPLKTLQGREMETVLEDLFKEVQPEVFRTDGGPSLITDG